MLLGRRLIHKLVFVFLIVVLGLLSLQFLERKDTSRARHHEHSSLRIALPGDLAALAARRCRRGLPAAGLRVLAPGARRRGTDTCWALGLQWCGAGPLAVHTATSSLWPLDGETALRVCSFTAWSLVEKTKTPGGQQEEQFCLQVTWEPWPCTSQAWRGVRPCRGR